MSDPVYDTWMRVPVAVTNIHPYTLGLESTRTVVSTSSSRPESTRTAVYYVCTAALIREFSKKPIDVVHVCGGNDNV